MLPVPTKDAPSKIGNVIAAYRGRWLLAGQPIAILALFGVFIWIVPLAGDDPTRDKWWLTAATAGMTLAASGAFWLWSTYRYNKFKARGYILEITDRELIKSIYDYHKVLQRMLTAVKAQEVQKLDGLLPELHALAQADRPAAMTRIEAELERLRAVTPR